MERIASLLPSTTEIACALGFESALVGRSHECDFPAGIAGLPVLTEPKLDASASSREIDDRVKQLVRDALSVYRVDAARLRELEPSVILTQDHCEVCAATVKDVEAALEDWMGARPRVVSLAPETLHEVWNDIRRVGEVLGEPERGRRVADDLAARMDRIRERARAAGPRPDVVCIEWIDPLMAAGNWVPELVEIAGGRDLLSEPGRHSAWLEWRELADADPDVVVMMPCGFDLARVRSEIEALGARDGWRELRAVREGRVFLTDGNQFFNRPGPRLVESAEILAEILHPERFPARHAGAAWQPL